MRQLWRLTRAALAAAVCVTTLGPGPAAALDLAPPRMPGGEAVDFSTPPGCAEDIDFYFIQPNQAVPDGNGVPGVMTSTIVVAGAGSFLWDMNVTTEIPHTFSADLLVFLTSPAGTRVTLTSINGENLDNVFNDNTWRDDAGELNPPGPVTLAEFENDVNESPLSPEEPLSAFRGEDPNGDWTLEVQDLYASYTGTLVSWGLDLVTLAESPEVVNLVAGNSISGDIADDETPLTRTLSLAQAYASLGDLNVTTLIDHPQSSDLVIELVPPTGVTITLSSHQGGPNADVFGNTLWTDKAGATNPPGAVTDNDFISGTVESPLAPQEPLGAAAGNQPGGAWTLRVIDTEPNGITGRFWDVLLNTNSYICPPNLGVNVDSPKFSRMDEPVPAWVEVQNTGAPTTAPVYVTVTLPISGSFLSATGPSWNCGGVAAGTLGGTLLCSRPGLAAATTSTITVLFNPPPAPLRMGYLEVVAETAGNANLDSYGGHHVQASAHSANHNPWDVNDRALYPLEFDTGAVEDGGQDAFDDWGKLRLRVFDPAGSLLAATLELRDLGQVYASGQRWRTPTRAVSDTIQASRSLYAPAHTDWLRYVDTFTNTGGVTRTVWVAWGGQLGSGSGTQTTGTSSGDAVLTAADTWAVTIDVDGPLAEDAPVGYAWRSPTDTTYQGPGLFDNDPFTDTWPSSGDSHLGHDFKLVLGPGASASLAYFVYHGLAEGQPGPDDCEFYGGCVVPAAGSQVALAEGTAAALALTPNFCDLSPAEFTKIVNWPGKAACAPYELFLPLLQR